MIAQYIADNLDYILALGGYLPKNELDSAKPSIGDPDFLAEIYALGQLAYLEQLGSNWCYAATPHHMRELRAGRPTPQQIEFYCTLETIWRDSGWTEAFPLDAAQVEIVERSLIHLRLEEADRLHIAQAIVLKAAWFLTNDSKIIKKCRNAQLPLRVRRPSECLEELSEGLFLRIDSPLSQTA